MWRRDRVCWKRGVDSGHHQPLEAATDLRARQQRVPRHHAAADHRGVREARQRHALRARQEPALDLRPAVEPRAAACGHGTRSCSSTISARARRSSRSGSTPTTARCPSRSSATSRPSHTAVSLHLLRLQHGRGELPRAGRQVPAPVRARLHLPRELHLVEVDQQHRAGRRACRHQPARRLPGVRQGG